MPIKKNGSTIYFSEFIGVEDAEMLYNMIINENFSKIDLGSCTYMHAAIFQLVIGSNLIVEKYPEDDLLKSWIVNTNFIK